MSCGFKQCVIGQDLNGLLRTHLWCPDDLPRLWDITEEENKIVTSDMKLHRLYFTQRPYNSKFESCYLTLKVPNKIEAGDILIFYFYLSRKTRLDFSGESSA